MKVWHYSRWDGTQREFSLEVQRSLDALSDLMMEGLDAQEALEWMRRGGFELAGMDMRVMGLEEILDELREAQRQLEEQYRLDESLDSLRERFEQLLDREESAQRDASGYESQRMNEFLDRRHGPEAPLSDAIERFEDWTFEDEQAGEDYQALRDEIARMRTLEEFMRQQGERFRGPEAADYETAQSIREQIESLEQMGRDLASGQLGSIDPGQVGQWLSEDAQRSLIWIRDLESNLEQAGYLRPGESGPELTPRAIRRIGASALASVYGALRKGRPGAHETRHQGAGLPRPDETRPYAFGDSMDIDVVRSLMNAIKRRPPSAQKKRETDSIAWGVEDLEVRETDHQTQTTTVLLLDLSWSMSWANRFPAAKRVALALDHLIRTRYPRDHFFVVGFSTRAREIPIRDLPETSWDMGEPFTNLQEGLMVAERLIAQHPTPSAQVLVITDGQPTAYFRGKELHVEWPMGYGGVSPHAVAETLKQVRRITRRGVTINTFMLDAAPELVGFVERMTQINKGRALYTSPTELGSFVMVDYLSGRRMRSA